MTDRARRPGTGRGEAAGASGLFTLSIVRPGPGRPIVEHWSYDTRAQALAELGLVAERVPNGTEIVLRDPEGTDLLRISRLA
jgi:hypothetical protein